VLSGSATRPELELKIQTSAFPSARGKTWIADPIQKLQIMRSLSLILLAALCCFFTGCFTPSPVAKLDAYGKLTPVVDAIEAFKRTQGRVPESLEEMMTVTGRTFELRNKGAEQGLRWSINYKKKSATSYEVSYNHVHYNLYFEDGKEAGWIFNPWA
jgi:hypothetical protein